jgi:hypothetical protein
MHVNACRDTSGKSSSNLDLFGCSGLCNSKESRKNLSKYLNDEREVLSIKFDVNSF